MLEKATRALTENTHDANTLPALKNVLAQLGGIVRVPWCGKAECEARMKEETGGKILNVPVDQKQPKAECAVCGSHATLLVNFGKSY